jgi:uncharacterized protein YbbK (DUF523 family)
MQPLIRILVSACLLGQRVRYDAGHKAQPWLLDELARRAELVPICPEAEAGLGIPRSPMKLADDAAAPRLLLVNDPNRDLTEVMNTWIAERLDSLGPLDAAILKARSPSCGHRVPIFTTQGQATGQFGQGLFAAALMAARPHLLVLDEEQLSTAAGQNALLQRLGLMKL